MSSTLGGYVDWKRFGWAGLEWGEVEALWATCMRETCCVIRVTLTVHLRHHFQVRRSRSTQHVITPDLTFQNI